MRAASSYITAWFGNAGWRRNIALFALGASATLLFAPFDAWWLLCLIIPFFYRLLNTAHSAVRAAKDGFWFGYGYFMVGTYWIALSLTVDAEQFGWLIPFSVLGLSAVFAIYFVAMAWLYHRTKRLHSALNPLLFCSVWVLIEYLRSVGGLGFPWNLLGYSLITTPLLSFASLVGVFGLSLIAAMLAVSLCYVPRYWRACLTAYALLACVWFVWGMARTDVKQDYTNSGLLLRLVQPNVAQAIKWQPEEAARIMRTLVGLSNLPSDAGVPDVIIWPESAIPYLWRSDALWPASLMSQLPSRSRLITGVVMQEGESVFNGLLALTHNGEASAHYKKRQLVPFGEFMPLRSIIPFDRIVPSVADFSAGMAQPSLHVAGDIKFQPLICYESAFPWLAHASDARPDALLILTNDAWFGTSIGPYQHAAMARVRAVEQGLPVIRVANTGISSVVDAHGNVLHALSLNQQGMLDVRLPNAANPTIYSRYGDMPVLLLISLALACIVVYNKKTTQG